MEAVVATRERAVTVLGCVVFFLAAFFYLYEYALQVAPSVMTTDLMHAFGVQAQGLGVMTAFFFYAYAPMQIPAGLMFDRFGPRILLSIAILICSAGAILFSSTSSITIASMGRFLMGTGSAFSFVGILVLVSRWFPPHLFAVTAGVAQLMSSVGAVAGEIPLANMSEALGWRSAMFIFAIIGFALALLTWLVVRDAPKDYVMPNIANRHENEWQRLKRVIKVKQTWAIGLYAFAVWAPIAVFGGLWVVPYLKELYGISTISASHASAMIWIGVGIGSPLFGWLSDHWGLRNRPLQICAIGGFFAAIAILYIPMNLSLMWLALLCLGIAAGGQTVSFASIKENHKPQYVGTACGINNMAVLAGGMVFHPLVGYILNMLWNGEMQQGVPLYTVSMYQSALFMLPACFALAIIASAFFIKETYAKPVEEASL